MENLVFTGSWGYISLAKVIMFLPEVCTSLNILDLIDAGKSHILNGGVFESLVDKANMLMKEEANDLNWNHLDQSGKFAMYRTNLLGQQQELHNAGSTLIRMALQNNPFWYNP